MIKTIAIVSLSSGLLGDWQDKILLLETSENQPSPDHYRRMLLRLRETGMCAFACPQTTPTMSHERKKHPRVLFLQVNRRMAA